MPPRPKEVLSKLQKIGFEIKRTSGSHIVLRHPDGRQTYIAMHTKDLPEGTFRAILKQAEISKDEFDLL
ncbi:MAG: type II toxin-antitoxin system HicA family toxin [Ignavibacteria bacterium]|jgi:predicted RNA binding protein YcfA (HicA-like mRNA interferase family)|nr:type II toxin-antitoxin system HicA family toxin [Ignavibacteria bacterium]